MILVETSILLHFHYSHIFIVNLQKYLIIMIIMKTKKTIVRIKESSRQKLKDNLTFIWDIKKFIHVLHLLDFNHHRLQKYK